MKLSSLIKYQCWTTIKPLLIFYTILYGIIGLSYLVVYLSFGSFDKVWFNGLEMSCLIYLGVTGSLGFNEDFKMAIQNGYTRKQIFMATFAMFIFVVTVMSIVDTVITHSIPSYSSLFNLMYGSNHSIIIQWIMLALIYFLSAIGAYLCALLANKIGKKTFYFIIIALGLSVFVILPLVINLYVPANIMMKIGEVITWMIGYAANGSIHFFNPLISITLMIAIMSGFAFITIKKTELR
ncbi:MAG: hypothetical protein RR512_09245 [Coprobacillus sp.]